MKFFQKYAKAQRAIFEFFDGIEFFEFLQSSLQEMQSMQESDFNRSMKLFIDIMLKNCSKGTTNPLLKRWAELREIQDSVDENYNNFRKALEDCNCPVAVQELYTGDPEMNPENREIINNLTQSDDDMMNNSENVMTGAVVDLVINSDPVESINKQMSEEKNDDDVIMKEVSKNDENQMNCTPPMVPPSIDDQLHEYLLLPGKGNSEIAKKAIKVVEEVTMEDEEGGSESDDEKLKIDESAEYGTEDLFDISVLKQKPNGVDKEFEAENITETSETLANDAQKME